MKFLTLFVVIFSIGILAGCEKQNEPELSPIEKVLSERFPEDPVSGEPCQQNSEYECGVLLVLYDEETWAKNTSPIPTVKEFLEEKGYKPEVTDVFNFIRTEVIYIGDFDVLPIIEELRNVQGVMETEPNYFVTINNPEPEAN